MPVSIYIEHINSNPDEEFANKLKKHINKIDDSFIIRSYRDLELRDEDKKWQDKIVENINSSDIIICILSSSFINSIDSEDKIHQTFYDAVNSDNKYVIPILYDQTNWSSINWIVKSNIIPFDLNPLINYSTSGIENIINNLVKSIETIIKEKNNLQNKKSINQKSNQNKQKIKENEKIVFISHDHDDADFAELLKLKLEKEEINAWIDTERLKIGQDWREEIDQGIEESIAVIAIMTPEARKSEYVTYEWSFAWGKNKKVFPLMLKKLLSILD